MFLIYAIKFKPHPEVKKKETDSLRQKAIRINNHFPFRFGNRQATSPSKGVKATT